jgi:hypothetical protein
MMNDNTEYLAKIDNALSFLEHSGNAFLKNHRVVDERQEEMFVEALEALNAATLAFLAKNLVFLSAVVGDKKYPQEILSLTSQAVNDQMEQEYENIRKSILTALVENETPVTVN